MNNSVNISEELKDLAPALIGVGTNMPNYFPEGYFDELPLAILRKTLPPAYKTQVPEGYFDSLPNAILAKIKAQQTENELDEVAPFLNTISREMPFQVPAGYFDQLSTPSFTEERETPVVSITKQKPGFKWLAAASVTALIGLLTWQIGFNNPKVDAGVAENAAQGLIDTAANIELEKSLSLLADNSLALYVDEDAMAEEEIQPAVNYLDTDDIENALKDFSEKDLTKYLEQEVVGKNI